MSFKEIKQKMKESLAVRLYVYLQIIIAVIIGIFIVRFLDALGVIYLIIYSIFILYSNLIFLRDFIKGNPKVIKFQFGLSIILFMILFIYRAVVGRFAWIGLIIIFLIALLDFFRLKEIK